MAIVKTTDKPAEWPQHYACCRPVREGAKWQYCEAHWPFLSPGEARELIRSYRR